MPPSAYEPDAAAIWITNRLSSLPEIQTIVGRHPTKGMWQVYERVVPEGGTYPCILFTAVTGNFRRGTGGYRVAARLFYEIKGITTGESYGGVASRLAQLIDLQMTAQQGNDPVNAGSAALRPVQREDFEGNERHNHYGAEYEVWIYAGA